jgi:tetratricopeptide (TPR) repeat protein
LRYQTIDIDDDNAANDLGLDQAIMTCVSAIADGISKEEYLLKVPEALLVPQNHLFEPFDPEDHLKLAMMFSRLIWNVCPVPSTGYRQDPLPEPKRNDRCLCGSGLKFKHCCMMLPPMPLDGLPIWGYLLDALSGEQLSDAIASKQIPMEFYGEIGNRWLEGGEPRKVVKLLEPLFAETQKKIDRRLDLALNVLCDALDELGHRHKKIRMLDHLANNNTGVSADACQRLVTVLIDQDDLKRAAEVFGQAMRSRPDDPNLATLEVLLMVRQGKDQGHIRDRIRFWKQKLRRWGQDDEPTMALLDEAEIDPYTAFRSNVEHAVNPVFIELRQWVTEVLLPRKIPVYDLQTMEPPGEDEIEEPYLRGHLEGVLEPDHEIRELERQWTDVFPGTKPFSTQIVINAEAWEDTQWMTFLQQHEQAADSLWILDDLVAALEGFPEIEWIGMADGVFDPIYDRARDILLKTIAVSESEIILPWVFPGNRPGLRLLYLRAMQSELGADKQKYNFEELIRINPDDNHGIRTVLINCYLRSQDNQKALDLAEEFSEDMMVDTRYGEVLASYRLGRMEDAEGLLREFHDERPKIAGALWKKRIKKPAVESHGVMLGGDDEAWFYREDMRDEWLATPGALDWVRKITR